MKDGKYRSKKPVEIKTMSIKRNMKPKHVPYTIIQHFGSRLTLGNPPDRPTEVPDFWGSWGTLRNEFHWLHCWKMLSQAGLRGSEALQVPSRALWVQNRDQVACEFLSLIWAWYWSSWICFWRACCQLNLSLSEILRATEVWSTSARSSSFSMLLARK